MSTIGNLREPGSKTIDDAAQAGAAQAAGQAPAPSAAASAQNSTGEFVSAPLPTSSGNGAPTESAREAATRKHNELQEMTEERLMSDPEYVKLKEKHEAWKDIEALFALVESNCLWAGDNKLTLDDVKALAADPLRSDEARAAARRLLENPSIWNELATGVDGQNDNVVGIADVQRFRQGMDSGLAAMREKVKGEVKEELRAETANSAVAAGQGSGGASGTGATGPLFAASTPSTKGGMEGAVENANNAIQNIGDSMNSIMAEMSDPKTSPERRKELQNQYNDLQQLQSMLTAMYKQMQEAISNITKMYSDVASNSIRNMR